MGLGNRYDEIEATFRAASTVSVSPRLRHRRRGSRENFLVASPSSNFQFLRAAIVLQNRQNLSSPGLIFALIFQVRPVPSVD